MLPAVRIPGVYEPSSFSVTQNEGSPNVCLAIDRYKDETETTYIIVSEEDFVTLCSRICVARAGVVL